VTTKSQDRHPFAELLTQYRQRKPGLTQTRLAELAGYDQAILVRMCQGKKDLTGPSGRERVVRLIETLADQGALMTLDEANALLLAADLPPLFERQTIEARLIERLSRMQIGQRVRRTNLPAPLTSFIGRAQEINDVRRLLNTTRLLTLTGAGGCGKTRLAQRVAADVLIAYSEGVWYAELASLTDPALVADSVARALGLIVIEQSSQERVLDYLRERHVLLVLDNCEHLIEAIAEFALTVLRACPRVTILTTSREALNVEGETAWRVPPLQPDEAGRLFVDRAAAARSDVVLSVQDTTVAHICQRLDGMPLAIELAAARLNSLSLNDIEARLDDRFALLAHGRRGALPRHQTLRALIDWSYDALSEPEKIAFCRLGVFVGGWSIDIAADVIGNDAESLLTQLIRKSLVVVDEHEGITHYRYLETIREYALQWLDERGEVEAARRLHAEAVARWGERVRKPFRGPHRLEWIKKMRLDQANLLAALNWSFSAEGDALIGCRIVCMLEIASPFVGVSIRVQDWVRKAKSAMTDDMLPGVRATLHRLYGYEVATPEIPTGLERAMELYKEANDPIGIADTTYDIGIVRLERDEHDEYGWHMLREFIQLADAAGDTSNANSARLNLAGWTQIVKRFDEAEAMLHESIQRCRDTHDLVYLTMMLTQLGHLLLEQMQFEKALPFFEEAASVARQIGNPLDEIRAQGHVAETIRFLGDAPRAVEINEQVMTFAREHVERSFHGLPILLLAKSLNDVGEQTRALPLLREMIVIFQERGVVNPEGYVAVFDALACVSSGQGNSLRAAKFAGKADAIMAAAKHRRGLHNDWEYAPYLAKARAALGDKAYDAAYAEGWAMSLERAITYALDEKEGNAPSSGKT
jgi:predicted ATPase